MAEPVVSFAVDKIGNMIIEEAKFLSGIEDQVEQLRSDLARMQSFLRNAEARQDEHSNLKLWISQTKDIAYEAEDLLERYAFKMESLKENIFRRSCILRECYVRHTVGTEIQKLQSKISSLTKSFQDYGIVPIAERGNRTTSDRGQQLRRAFSTTVEDDLIIPLDDDVEMLVGRLVDEAYAVVSIHGMGGLGKSTLAKWVYNHPKVQGYFEYIAWVSVSKQWQKREILQGILIKFFPEKRDEITKWREEELVRELSKTMQKKKSFVVLDDIWSPEVWESMKDAFPIKDKESKLKVLLTTRNRGIAFDIAPKGFHHEPRLLNDSESWKLLQLKALRERTFTGPEEKRKMEDLGKKMVKRCGGLPLAIDVLAGILVNRREWDDIDRTIKARIGRSRVIDEILSLSYNDLRPELKPFFLYLSRFPEGSKIEVEQLYQLWLAEGMISAKDKKGEESMIDVTEHYLEELADRSMVQIKVDEDMVGKTRFKYCRLHDVMRDLSLEKAKEENFLLYVHSRNGFGDEIYESSSSSHEIHRLAIHFQKKDGVPDYIPPQERMTRHLRSLRFFIQGGIQEMMKIQFRWFGMLRVLELEGLDGVQVTKFEVIGSLIHLRYLSFRILGLVGSHELPPSLANLKHLQTINLQISGSIRVPNIFWKMPQLKHIYLPQDMYKNDGDEKLKFDGLNKLEILEGFDSRFSSYKDLDKLPNLRYVYIKHFVEYHDNIDGLSTFISSSKRLNKVRLYLDLSETWDETIVPIVVNQLYACGKITRLTISGVVCKFPKYLDVNNLALDLVSLKLDLEVRDDPMETFESFPNLRYLVLFRCYRGSEIRCRAQGFRRLRSLVMEDLWSLAEWSIEQGSMPNLSSLTIGNCPELTRVPDGLMFIQTLKKLKARRMPREFVKRLQGEDFHKIRHVPLVKIIQ